MTLLKNNKILVFFFIFGLLQIYYLYSKRSNFYFEILKNPLKKDSHIEFALEEHIIEASQIIKNHNLKGFNLSSELSDRHSYFYQRIIEYNYPIKFDPKEEKTLFKINENKNICTSIFKGNFVELRKCD